MTTSWPKSASCPHKIRSGWSVAGSTQSAFMECSTFRRPSGRRSHVQAREWTSSAHLPHAVGVDSRPVHAGIPARTQRFWNHAAVCAPELERRAGSNRQCPNVTEWAQILAQQRNDRSRQAEANRFNCLILMKNLVRPSGFEPLAFCSGGKRSAPILRKSRSAFGAIRLVKPLPRRSSHNKKGLCPARAEKDASFPGARST